MSEIATEDRRAYLVCDKRIDEVVKDGIDIAEIDRKLLKKIEELTLYMIQQQKEIDELKTELKNKNQSTMKNITYLAILFMVVLLFNSCKKNGGIPHYVIDADLKTAFDFKPGTYWIYKDSISGRVDSFAVRSNMSNTGTVSGNYSIDGIKIYITEYNGGSLIDTSDWVFNLSINFEELIWYKNFNTGNYYFDFEPLFTYPFKNGSLNMIDGQYGNDAPITTNIYSSYTVAGNSYSNIAEINNEYSENNKLYYDDWFYISSEIGYIKINIYDPYDSIYKVWQIQRCKIIK